ncbi:hydantoinase/oxoprolinase family protein [Parapusillimonas granuli]|uniref:Hydantoinase/oxoprolinase family protein n=1 Tax=Parapusillimonas granuli TaxID=380911 RepID=A0A853G9V3_9BURK|nr:hydantoinase/oxoprolinase family protein [Parapusillimonas granuli]MBB5216459.1 N-methylhydantoinase A [Parapusillimonas granuli]NYT51526.1 hydantoinase/oxoprolinase family protein [Parapusillimonas granuli]
MATQHSFSLSRPTVSVAVDTGGTHTDVVLTDDTRILTMKVPTTPKDISLGIVDGVKQITQLANIPISQVDRFFYASTFATNLIVEGTEAHIGLITTRGFRDVLQIARASRKPDVYDIHWRPNTPLVPRHLRLEVTERITHTGEILTRLDEDGVHTAFRQFIEQGISTVAVCLLHAYANPIHERRIREIAQAHYPDIDISLSSDVAREFREYERTSTTCVSAFIKKPIEAHLARLTKALEDEGARSIRYIMRANGGVSTFERSAAQPAAVTHSGVMGGIVGAAALGRRCGIRNLVTLDMGGTSTDISLITNGVLPLTNRSNVGGNPVLIPTLDMVTIGAGGGSLGWVEGDKAMRVGPRSAGSVPGPACYGQGGTQPTVTDANLACGRLNDDYFLAGKRKLYPELSNQALDALAGQLGLSRAQTALGILSITEANMADAVRLVSVEKGVDPRDYTLVAFGGAGGLHAARLAEALNISSILIPPAPGNLSATGLLCADIRHDFARSHVCALAPDVAVEIRPLLEELRGQAVEALTNDGVEEKDGIFSYSLDLRYQGQNYELSVSLTEQDLADGFAGTQARFHALHERVYGYHLNKRPVQLVNVRVTALGCISTDPWLAQPEINPTPAVPAGTREVVLGLNDVRALPVYRFSEMLPGQTVDAPAVIEYPGSTVFMPPNWTARLDSNFCLHMRAL